MSTEDPGDIFQDILPGISTDEDYQYSNQPDENLNQDQNQQDQLDQNLLQQSDFSELPEETFLEGIGDINLENTENQPLFNIENWELNDNELNEFISEGFKIREFFNGITFKGCNFSSNESGELDIGIELLQQNNFKFFVDRMIFAHKQHDSSDPIVDNNIRHFLDNQDYEGSKTFNIKRKFGSFYLDIQHMFENYTINEQLFYNQRTENSGFPIFLRNVLKTNIINLNKSYYILDTTSEDANRRNWSSLAEIYHEIKFTQTTFLQEFFKLRVKNFSKVNIYQEENDNAIKKDFNKLLIIFEDTYKTNVVLKHGLFNLVKNVKDKDTMQEFIFQFCYYCFGINYVLYLSIYNGTDFEFSEGEFTKQNIELSSYNKVYDDWLGKIQITNQMALQTTLENILKNEFKNTNNTFIDFETMPMKSKSFIGLMNSLNSIFFTYFFLARNPQAQWKSPYTNSNIFDNRSFVDLKLTRLAESRYLPPPSCAVSFNLINPSNQVVKHPLFYSRSKAPFNLLERLFQSLSNWPERLVNSFNILSLDPLSNLSTRKLLITNINMYDGNPLLMENRDIYCFKHYPVKSIKEINLNSNNYDVTVHFKTWLFCAAYYGYLQMHKNKIMNVDLKNYEPVKIGGKKTNIEKQVEIYHSLLKYTFQLPDDWVNGLPERSIIAHDLTIFNDYRKNQLKFLFHLLDNNLGLLPISFLFEEFMGFLTYNDENGVLKKKNLSHVNTLDKNQYIKFFNQSQPYFSNDENGNLMTECLSNTYISTFINGEYSKLFSELLDNHGSLKKYGHTLVDYSPATLWVVVCKDIRKTKEIFTRLKTIWDSLGNIQTQGFIEEFLKNEDLKNHYSFLPYPNFGNDPTKNNTFENIPLLIPDNTFGSFLIWKQSFFDLIEQHVLIDKPIFEEKIYQKFRKSGDAEKKESLNEWRDEKEILELADSEHQNPIEASYGFYVMSMKLRRRSYSYKYSDETRHIPWFERPNYSFFQLKNQIWNPSEYPFNKAQKVDNEDKNSLNFDTTRHNIYGIFAREKKKKRNQDEIYDQTKRFIQGKFQPLFVVDIGETKFLNYSQVYHKDFMDINDKKNLKKLKIHKTKAQRKKEIEEQKKRKESINESDEESDESLSEEEIEEETQEKQPKNDSFFKKPPSPNQSDKNAKLIYELRHFLIDIYNDKTIINNIPTGIIAFYRDQYGNVKLYGLPFLTREYNYLGEKNTNQEEEDLIKDIEKLWTKNCPTHTSLGFKLFPNIQEGMRSKLDVCFHNILELDTVCEGNSSYLNSSLENIDYPEFIFLIFKTLITFIKHYQQIQKNTLLFIRLDTLKRLGTVPQNVFIYLLRKFFDFTVCIFKEMYISQRLNPNIDEENFYAYDYVPCAFEDGYNDTKSYFAFDAVVSNMNFFHILKKPNIGLTETKNDWIKQRVFMDKTKPFLIRPMPTIEELNIMLSFFLKQYYTSALFGLNSKKFSPQFVENFTKEQWGYDSREYPNEKNATCLFDALNSFRLTSSFLQTSAAAKNSIKGITHSIYEQFLLPKNFRQFKKMSKPQRKAFVLIYCKNNMNVRHHLFNYRYLYPDVDKSLQRSMTTNSDGVDKVTEFYLFKIPNNIQFTTPELNSLMTIDYIKEIKSWDNSLILNSITNSLTTEKHDTIQKYSNRLFLEDMIKDKLFNDVSLLSEGQSQKFDNLSADKISLSDFNKLSMIEQFDIIISKDRTEKYSDKFNSKSGYSDKFFNFVTNNKTLELANTKELADYIQNSYIETDEHFGKLNLLRKFVISNDNIRDLIYDSLISFLEIVFQFIYKLNNNDIYTIDKKLDQLMKISDDEIIINANLLTDYMVPSSENELSMIDLIDILLLEYPENYDSLHFMKEIYKIAKTDSRLFWKDSDTNLILHPNYDFQLQVDNLINKNVEYYNQLFFTIIDEQIIPNIPPKLNIGTLQDIIDNISIDSTRYNEYIRTFSKDSLGAEEEINIPQISISSLFQNTTYPISEKPKLSQLRHFFNSFDGTRDILQQWINSQNTLPTNILETSISNRMLSWNITFIVQDTKDNQITNLIDNVLYLDKLKNNIFELDQTNSRFNFLGSYFSNQNITVPRHFEFNPTKFLNVFNIKKENFDGFQKFTLLMLGPVELAIYNANLIYNSANVILSDLINDTNFNFNNLQAYIFNKKVFIIEDIPNNFTRETFNFVSKTDFYDKIFK